MLFEKSIIYFFSFKKENALLKNNSIVTTFKYYNLSIYETESQLNLHHFNSLEAIFLAFMNEILRVKKR